MNRVVALGTRLFVVSRHARAALVLAGTLAAIGCGGGNSMADAAQPDVQLADVPMDSPPPPANTVCAAATVLIPDVPVTDESTAAALPVPLTCYRNSMGRKVLYYRMTVPAGQTVTLTVTPDAGFDAVIRWFDSCASTSCLRWDDHGDVGRPEIGHWANRGTSAVDVIAQVSAFSDAQISPFSIVAHLVPSPIGPLCAEPHVVAGLTTLLGESFEFADGGSTRCYAIPSVAEMYYQVSVAAGQRLTVSAMLMGPHSPIIGLFDTCAATTCLATSDLSSVSPRTSATYLNATTAARDVMVSVGIRSPWTLDTYDLSFVMAP